jgi:trehalose utilization protein
MALIDVLRLVLASTREGNFHSNVPPRRHSVLFCYFKMGEVFDVLISRGWTTIPYQNATWQTFPQLKYFTSDMHNHLKKSARNVSAIFLVARHFKKGPPPTMPLILIINT